MRVRPRGLWLKPLAKRLEIIGGCLPPVVHLMLTGSSRRIRELRRDEWDGYAWCCVGGESKWRGRLNWTIALKAVAREAQSRSSALERGREGVKKLQNPLYNVV